MLGYDPIIRDIPNFPNYQISENGEVYNKTTGKEVSPYVNSTGYMQFCVNVNGERTKIKVHRILAEIFIPNPLNKTIVDHIDRNRLNNKLENLRWVTSSENSTNRNLHSNNTSGHEGIGHRRRRGLDKWRARIMKNDETIEKLFPYTEKGFQEAIEWRNQKKEELHKID